MRALIQRVKKCSVVIDGSVESSIEQGLLILLGVKNDDTAQDAKSLAERCAALRIFEDTNIKMNLNVNNIHGQVMVVSQFTLYGDTDKGHRPSFTQAAPPKIAEPLYNQFVEHLSNVLWNKKVATGVFRAMMDVELVNDGPVTVLLESK
ncbi:MAG TPA: D-aminoacyl-tRNA deacylase [Bacteroidota bacterium]|nr:D-aminoacyl-tRNA deacylase [Bacteroidota bacterium]